MKKNLKIGKALVSLVLQMDLNIRGRLDKSYITEEAG
jgi:hypothetical protein